MTDVIDFPATQVQADFLPQPGNRYQAYALHHQFKSPSFTFVFQDWSMSSFPYDQLGSGRFSILNDECNRDGDGAISMNIGNAGSWYEVVITGHNIFGLYYKLFNHEVNWVWELPKDRAAVKNGEPVVHSIEIKEGTTKKRAAFLS
jgi:hypothetical protein